MRKCVSAIVLLCVAVTLCYGGPRTIHSSKPEFKPRAHSAWAEKGRIVGPLRNCPGCKIEVLDAKDKVIKTLDIPKGAKAYEAEWLVPGVYHMRVTAKGYRPKLMLDLEVRARNDLWIVLEF